ATTASAPQARQCVDPFHVMKLANGAVDTARRWAWNQARRSGEGTARWVKRTRWALVKDRTPVHRPTPGPGGAPPVRERAVPGLVAEGRTEGGVPDGRVRGGCLGAIPGRVAGR